MTLLKERSTKISYYYVKIQPPSLHIPYSADIKTDQKMSKIYSNWTKQDKEHEIWGKTNLNKKRKILPGTPEE